MTERGKNLIDRGPETITAAMVHTLQLSTVAIIRQLLEDLRACQKLSDYRQFQLTLLDASLEAQSFQGVARANTIRRRRGKTTPDCESGDWDIELLVADRVVRQLRCVGDAMAWRLFDFDRRIIVALSRNDPVGPIVGKTGLAGEVAVAENVWRSRRAFGLLHDLTSVLRIADLTLFEPTGERNLVEAKTGGRRVPASQMTRINRALAVLNEGAPIKADGTTILVHKSSVQMKTHLKQLGEGLRLAAKEGLRSLRLRRGWAVTCGVLPAVTQQQIDEGEWDSLKAAAFQKASMDDELHHLRGVAVDRATADPGLAPFTIYPLSAEECALLTCDLAFFDSTLGWSQLARAFEDRGFEVATRLPEASGPQPGETSVLDARKGDARVTLHGHGVVQLLCELTDLSCFAAATEDMMSQARESARPGLESRGLLLYSNERATWR